MEEEADKKPLSDIAQFRILILLGVVSVEKKVSIPQNRRPKIIDFPS